MVAERSEWDDGRWELEDTPPRRSGSRLHVPSSSTMYFGASPWDNVAPSATPIRASGSSARSSSSPSEAPDVEMEYDSDRAWWYDRDEGMSGMSDEASFQEEEAELLAKRLVRMTVGQSKKLSQHAADNAQLEDLPLVKNWQVETDFDDEDEFLIYHAPTAPFLKPRVVPPKPAYPTSPMSIIAWKKSAYVHEFLEKCRIQCEIVENLRMKRRMIKSRQLSGSKLGVEKTAQHLKKGGNKNRNKQLRKIETRLFDDISQA